MVKNSPVQPLYHNSAGSCSIFMPWFFTGQRPCSELNIPVIDWGKSCSVFSSRLEVEANLQHLSFIAWYWEWAVPAPSAFPLCVESSLTSVNGYREQEKSAFLQTSYFYVWLGHLVAFVTKLLHDCKKKLLTTGHGESPILSSTIRAQMPNYLCQDILLLKTRLLKNNMQRKKARGFALLCEQLQHTK